MPYGYPPSHRDTREPQPEVCDLCGKLVGAVRLRETHVLGLRGYQICDEHAWAFRTTKRDVDAATPGLPSPKLIGSNRVHPAGDEPWWYAEFGHRLEIDGDGHYLDLNVTAPPHYHLTLDTNSD